MNFNQQFGQGSYQGYSYPRPMTNGRSWGTKAPYNPNSGYRAPLGSYPQRKKSGAKIKDGKNGKPCITAWKKNRGAFLTLIACPNNGENALAKGGAIIRNKKGEEYARWTATIVNRTTGSVSTHSALYNLSTGKLYLPDLKMVASPRANNGGYFGNSFVSKRR